MATVRAMADSSELLGPVGPINTLDIASEKAWEPLPTLDAPESVVGTTPRLASPSPHPVSPHPGRTVRSAMRLDQRSEWADRMSGANRRSPEGGRACSKRAAEVSPLNAASRSSDSSAGNRRYYF
jgi:hypothetical protein